MLFGWCVLTVTVVEYESLNDDYIDRGNIMNLNKSEMCMGNIRLIYDDGA